MTTPAEAAAAAQQYFNNLNADREEYANWATGVVGGGPGNNGRYPLRTYTGEQIFVPSPAQIVADAMPATPFEFGCIGSIGLPWGTWPSRPAKDYFASLSACQAVYPFATSLEQEMDWLGWQKALYSGRPIKVDKRYHWKMCNSHPDTWLPLEEIAGLTNIDCSFSEFHWEDFRATTDDTEFVQNASFDSSGNWVNASQYPSNQIIPAVFGSGQAVMFDPSTPVADQGRFYQFGQYVTLQPGRYTVRCELIAELGQSFSFPSPGNNNQPAYAGIGFFSNAPGNGSNPFGGSASFDIQSEIFKGGPVSQVRQFDIYVTQTTSAWLTFGGGGYVSYYVQYFGIKRWLPNCAILCTRDGSPHHYPVPAGMKNFLVWGPDKSHTGTIFARWKSFSNTDGNLVIFEGMIVQGFWNQFRFGTGAYLLAFDNCGGGGSHTAIWFETGTFNAGENNRFYRGGFGNCDVLVNNEGGSEITFYGASTDYANQMCVENRGNINWIGVHIEHNVPTDVNKPAFELKDGGSCLLVGGMYLGAGGVNTSPCAPISTNNSRCTFTVMGTELYNLTSAPDGVGKGAVMSGPGQLKIVDWKNKGNPNLGPRVLSWSPSMDVLGGAGRAEAVSGSPFITGMGIDPSGIRLIGGSYFYPSAPSTDLITSQWNTSRLQLTRSTVTSLSGTQSLKVQKKAPYGQGDGCRLMFFVPARPGHGVIGEFSATFPEAVAGKPAGSTATLYYRRFWCQVIGYDSYGRPVLGENWDFAGEQNFTVPLDGSGAGVWQRRSINTNYLGSGSTDVNKSTASGAPAWATHLAILLDHESLPAMSYFIDDFVANIV